MRDQGDGVRELSGGAPDARRSVRKGAETSTVERHGVSLHSVWFVAGLVREADQRIKNLRGRQSGRI